ncbi:MAG TPA: glucoamylase family protein [Acidobacteriota bacterium]
MAGLSVHQSQTLDKLQRDSFGYFIHETNPDNGLVLDKTRDDWPANIAGVGMALAAYVIGAERGFISRKEAVKRVLTCLRFFSTCEQSRGEQASGFRGFYYHFLDMKSGRRAWKSELSTIDTTFLVAGALAAGAYFQAEDEQEQEIRTLADALYRRMDWNWARNGDALVSHGWKPESGFLRYRWQGYDEAILLYILGLGSPTYPLPEESYQAWASTYRWKKICGYDFLYAGPLFIHQLSHLWVDFRLIHDAFMRDKGIDYFENSRRAAFVQREYAIRNPKGFKGYCETCWGITASDGPGPAVRKVDGVRRRFYDYVARGVPYGPDDGTVAPWAVVASLPFAPEIVIPTIEHFHHLKLRAANPYGFKATFNPTFPGKPGSKYGWISPWHYAINEGPTVLMIENYRSGFLWECMRRCPYVVAGLRRAGFRGGWLEG